MTNITRSSWTKRAAAGFVGALAVAALCLPLAPAKANVAFGISVPGVAVGVGAPYGYYYPRYYAYRYHPYYAYPAYSGFYFNFGGGHHWHGHHR